VETMQRTRETTHGGGESGQLAELLACEREVAELMAAARVEAQRRVAEARSEADGAMAELLASLETTCEQARRELREESEKSIRDILTRAAAQADRFERVSEADIERLTASAFRRLVGAGDPA
jgi:vacuolar-type H+-ATPase subunit H